MANSTANDWEILSPLDTEPRRDGAREIRLLREAIEQRIEKEHITPVTDDLLENQGMEHKPGSAMAYFEDNDGEDIGPLNRPDGLTILDDGTIDAGRLWVDTKDGTYQAYVYVDDTDLWVPVKAVAVSGPIPNSYVNFDGTQRGDYGTKVTLTFLPRRVHIHKSDDVETDAATGYSGTFILPETGPPDDSFSNTLVSRTSGSSRRFTLKRSGDDGFDLELKYEGDNLSQFNGTWRAFVSGASA